MSYTTWKPWLGYLLHQDHGSHPHRNPLTSHFFLRGLDGNETSFSTKSFPLSNMLHYNMFCTILEFFLLKFYFYFILMIGYLIPYFIVHQLSHGPIFGLRRHYYIFLSFFLTHLHQLTTDTHWDDILRNSVSSSLSLSLSLSVLDYAHTLSNTHTLPLHHHLLHFVTWYQSAWLSNRSC